MKTNVGIICIISSALLGCETTSIEPQFFPIAIHDNIGEQKFDIMIQNTSTKSVCIDVQNWPNNVGELHYAADIVSVEIGSKSYPIRDSNLGYCPSGCEDHKIKAGETLEGSIPYKLFEILDSEKNSKKELSFTPAAFECGR